MYWLVSRKVAFDLARPGRRALRGRACSFASLQRPGCQVAGKSAPRSPLATPPEILPSAETCFLCPAEVVLRDTDAGDCGARGGGDARRSAAGAATTTRAHPTHPTCAHLPLRHARAQLGSSRRNVARAARGARRALTLGVRENVTPAYGCGGTVEPPLPFLREWRRGASAAKWRGSSVLCLLSQPPVCCLLSR